MSTGKLLGCSSTRCASGQLRELPRSADTRTSTDCVPKCWAHRFLPCWALSASTPSLACAPPHSHQPCQHLARTHSWVNLSVESLGATREPLIFQEIGLTLSAAGENPLVPDSVSIIMCLSSFLLHVAQFFPRDHLACRDCSTHANLCLFSHGFLARVSVFLLLPPLPPSMLALLLQ